MPIDYRRYPPGWHAFSRSIRLERAQNRCESCGVENHTPAPWRPTTRIVLTVAHLCACDPPCAEPSHVRALCQREHLALDQQLHAHRAAETRRRRTEALGHTSFLEPTP